MKIKKKSRNKKKKKNNYENKKSKEERNISKIIHFLQFDRYHTNTLLYLVIKDISKTQRIIQVYIILQLLINKTNERS